MHRPGPKAVAPRPAFLSLWATLPASICLGLICSMVPVSAEGPRVNGSTNTARCPVTGELLKIDGDPTSYSVVEFKGGQKLYVKDEAAAKAYRQTPRDYWLSPWNLPPEGDDGKRGLPDMQGRNLSCAVTPDDWFIVNTMKTARVMHIGGQCIYFCCQACRTTFWRQPGKSIVGAGSDANSVDKTGSKWTKSSGCLSTGEGYGATFVMGSILVTAVLSILSFAVLTKLYRSTVPSVPPLGKPVSGRHRGFDRLGVQSSGAGVDADFGGTYCDDDDETDTI